jgi:hypothetical protein
VLYSLKTSTFSTHPGSLLCIIAGIFPDVLSFVVQYCNGSLFVEEEHKKKLIDCFDFLRALACKNEAIQIR